MLQYPQLFKYCIGDYCGIRLTWKNEKQTMFSKPMTKLLILIHYKISSEMYLWLHLWWQEWHCTEHFQFSGINFCLVDHKVHQHSQDEALQIRSCKYTEGFFFTNLGLVEFKVGYLAFFLLFSVIGSFGRFWMSIVCKGVPAPLFKSLTP